MFKLAGVSVAGFRSLGRDLVRVGKDIPDICDYQGPLGPSLADGFDSLDAILRLIGV